MKANARKAIQHSYHKLADYRGYKRIWLQNQKLKQAGFDQGVSYSIEYVSENHSYKITLDPQGERVVSGKTNKASGKVTPIIDLTGKSIEVFGKDSPRVRVDFHYGELSISLHHQDRKKIEREEAFIANASKGMLTKGSLCSGIGVAAAALADGLQDVGVKSSLSWIVDREPKYLQVAIDNNYAVSKDTLIIEGSLEEIEPELLPQTDLVQFSLACTGYSKAGKSKNKIELAEQHDTDATSIFGLVKIIDKTNPAILVSENVTEAMSSATYALLKSMLTLLGYKIYDVILNEEQAGSFEARTRYWFIAVSSGLPEIDVSQIDTFPKAYSKLAELVEPNTVTDTMWRKHDYLDAKQDRDIAAGKGFRRALFTLDSNKFNCVGRHYNKRRSTDGFVVNDSGLERLLTTTEHCRIKDIPECFIKNVVNTTAHEGLGQSILFNHARGIGRLIGRGLFPRSENVVSIKSRAPIKLPDAMQPEIKCMEVYQMDIFN